MSTVVIGGRVEFACPVRLDDPPEDRDYDYDPLEGAEPDDWEGDVEWQEHPEFGVKFTRFTVCGHTAFLHLSSLADHDLAFVHLEGALKTFHSQCVKNRRRWVLLNFLDDMTAWKTTTPPPTDVLNPPFMLSKLEDLVALNENKSFNATQFHRPDPILDLRRHWISKIKPSFERHLFCVSLDPVGKVAACSPGEWVHDVPLPDLLASYVTAFPRSVTEPVFHRLRHPCQQEVLLSAVKVHRDVLLRRLDRSISIHEFVRNLTPEEQTQYWSENPGLYNSTRYDNDFAHHMADAFVTLRDNPQADLKKVLKTEKFWEMWNGIEK